MRIWNKMLTPCYLYDQQTNRTCIHTIYQIAEKSCHQPTNYQNQISYETNQPDHYVLVEPTEYTNQTCTLQRAQQLIMTPLMFVNLYTYGILPIYAVRSGYQCEPIPSFYIIADIN